MNTGERVELPDGWEVVGYRQTYYTYRNGRVNGLYLDLAADEAVVEESGQLWSGPGPFSVGYSRAIDDMFVVRRTAAYVQVDYSSDGYGTRYTFIDPSAELRVGDLVEVPVSYGTKVGTVRALGRGGWGGDCKPVLAKLTRESL